MVLEEGSHQAIVGRRLVELLHQLAVTVLEELAAELGIEVQHRLPAVCMPFLSRASLFDVMDVLFAAPQPPSRAAAILEAVRRLNAEADAAPEAAVEPPWPRG